MDDRSFNPKEFAHDLNNLLAVIKLYAQLGMRDPTASESLKESFHYILDQADEAIQRTGKLNKDFIYSGERMKILLSNLPGLAYRCKNAPGWPMEFISEGCLQLTGYQPEDFINSEKFQFGDIIHPDDQQYVHDTIQDLIGKGLPFTIEYRIFTKDGIEKRVWEKGRKVISPGDAVYLEGFIMDISERIHFEEALKLSEEKYSKVFKSSPFAIVITQLSDGKILDINPAFEQIFGYSRRDCIGKTSILLKLWENLADREAVVADLQNEQKVYNREYAFRKKSGEIRQGLYSAEMVSIGENPCMLSIVSDITILKQVESERKKIEEHLIRTQKMEVIGKLAGGVAHEFNNTLQVINTLSELSMLKLPLDHPVVPHLQQIRNSVKQSSSFVSQLLAFARKQPVNPQSLNLNDFIQALDQVIRRLIGENIRLEWLPQEGLWNILLDPMQLNQVLLNLILNARDAITGEGKIKIMTANESLVESVEPDNQEYVPGEYVMFSFADNGCGIDEQAMSMIFEPFFTTKPRGKGTGLGLATVYGIVRQNKGFIQVESKPGQGTEFRIYFPRYRG